jgi:glycolate oxidase FAD binding subunit
VGDIEPLASVLGDALRFHDPVSVDGVRVGATLTPSDTRSLGAALAALSEARCAVIPRGAGTQLGFGNPPRRADCFLSLEAFAGVDELDASEGVCHAGAGTTLSDLRSQVHDAGWELPIDDAGRGGTLGGALATAAIAPRALGLGRPRDIVLGYEVVLADGTATRCGGRVVKNVTGYDMARLYTGSLGSIGVITGAWLRLRPRPESVSVLQGGELSDTEACRVGTLASRLTTARTCLLAQEARGLRPTIELAGDASSVERDSEELAGEGLRVTNPMLRDVAAMRRFSGLPGTLRHVVSFLPTKIDACLAALRECPSELLVMPGLGIVCARGNASDAEALFEVAERAARLSGGRCVCELAPPEVKHGRDVFASPHAEVVLSSALKARFDANGVLNRGRFAGGV